MTDLEIQAGLKILEVIEMAVADWQKLKSGKINPRDVLDKLNLFTSTIDTNDKAADASVDSKFSK